VSGSTRFTVLSAAGVVSTSFEYVSGVCFGFVPVHLLVRKRWEPKTPCLESLIVGLRQTMYMAGSYQRYVVGNMTSKPSLTGIRHNISKYIITESISRNNAAVMSRTYGASIGTSFVI